MTTNQKTLMGASTYFRYLPPVRFVRIESLTNSPKFIIPLLVSPDEDLAALAVEIRKALSTRRIGLDLDFYPPLSCPASDLDTVRDFINPAAALNFYRQMISQDDKRAYDVSFVADNIPATRRALKYSNLVWQPRRFTLLQNATTKCWV